MKLHSDAGGYRITAYGPGFVRVNEAVLTGTVLLGGDTPATDVEERVPGDLCSATMARLRAHDPEVVIIGTGARHVFLPQELIAPLVRAGIGVEVMSTSAACRTWNILSAEGRRIAALLLPIEEGSRNPLTGAGIGADRQAFRHA